MKKYISTISLTALLAVNIAYSAQPAQKPLTAQERIRLNTLLVHQTRLNMDMGRLQRQDKKIPASMTKDLTNVTNTINKYEQRDPVAFAQVKKGSTPAVKRPSTPAKPVVMPKEEQQPLPMPPAPSIEEEEGGIIPFQPMPLEQPKKLYLNGDLNYPAIDRNIDKIKRMSSKNYKEDEMNVLVSQLKDELGMSKIIGEKQEIIVQILKNRLNNAIFPEEQIKIELKPILEPVVEPAPTPQPINIIVGTEQNDQIKNSPAFDAMKKYAIGKGQSASENNLLRKETFDFITTYEGDYFVGNNEPNYEWLGGLLRAAKSDTGTKDGAQGIINSMANIVIEQLKISQQNASTLRSKISKYINDEYQNIK